MTDTVIVHKDDLDLILQCITPDQRLFGPGVADAFVRLSTALDSSAKLPKITYITYIYADDWSAVYVDGELLCQGHEIQTASWLSLLRKQGVETEDVDFTDGAYDDQLEGLQRRGSFPTLLSTALTMNASD